MKRIFILLTLALFIVGASFADEAVLIDFTKLVADSGGDDEGQAPDQNEHTLMNFGNVKLAGGNFTQEQADAMNTSLAIGRWDVTFSSSSRSVTNALYTYTKEAQSKQYGTVMGVRIHFPVEAFNSKAYIKPPFEIPAYEPAAEGEESDEEGGTAKSRFEDGYGVIKNVGTIKSIAVDVYGLNFPYGLQVILIDANGAEHYYNMGSLKFDGWSRLTWNNPQYVSDVRNRELRLYPLYPFNQPFVKFGGFQISRNADQIGGDFVTYFRQVSIVYDKAVLDQDRDIEDESEWNIIFDRENAKQQREMERFGDLQVRRDLEKQRQATEQYYVPGRIQEEGGGEE